MTSDRAHVPAKCDKCEADLYSPIACASCHTLYPVPESLDHFALFGLPRAQDLDEADLHRRYIELTAQVHPDYFSGPSSQTQRLALTLSARVNEAYRVLRDPLLRAEYILETSGGPAASEDRTVAPDLLGRVMMLREQIEEAREIGDEAGLKTIATQVRGELEQMTRRVFELARRVAEEPQEEDRRELRRVLNAVKYLRSLLDQVEGEAPGAREGAPNGAGRDDVR